MSVPIEEIKKDYYTTYRYEDREVDTFIIKRVKISKKIERYTYLANYFPASDEVYAYNYSMYSKRFRVANIDRKKNKHFNPKKLEFVDDIYECIGSEPMPYPMLDRFRLSDEDDYDTKGE